MSVSPHVPAHGSPSWRPSEPLPGARSVVRAVGDIDIANVRALDEQLKAAVTEKHHERHLVLDLAAVTFMDSTGLSALEDARRRLGVRFWLANTPARVQRLLDLAGLTEPFAVLPGVPPLALLPHPRRPGSSEHPGHPEGGLDW